MNKEKNKKENLSKGDEKILRLIKIAQEIVIREDEKLLKELAKH